MESASRSHGVKTKMGSVGDEVLAGKMRVQVGAGWRGGCTGLEDTARNGDFVGTEAHRKDRPPSVCDCHSGQVA